MGGRAIDYECGIINKILEQLNVMCKMLKRTMPNLPCLRYLKPVYSVEKKKPPCS